MLKTAESCSPRHPDKICDIISDSILDECLKQDKNSRVAIETMGGHNIISVTGELTTEAYIDVHQIVKKIVGDKYGVQVNIVQQSPNIANGVDTGGAGDQGIMVGYACNENEEMIPQELYLARNLCKFIYDKYQEDGKTQITLEDGDIKTIVASFCNVSNNELRTIVERWLENFEINSNDIELHINPAGEWNIGSFDADTGLTGRKIVCDAYGPQVAVGGGAFSGKDPSKVDRSGAYMARYIATDLLKKNNYSEVFVKLAYAIGVEEPVMAVYKTEDKYWENIDLNVYKCTPKSIIEKLQLQLPIYGEVSKWGSFGNGFIWDNM